MIKQFFRWIKHYLNKGEAHYYVNQFLKSLNGTELVKETETRVLEYRMKKAEELLASEWLPKQKDLHAKVDFTIRYHDQLQSNQTLTLLFDEPLYLPFDWYLEKEEEDLMHVQVMTALALSGQLHEKDSNLFIIITKHDRAVFGTMSAITYRVCRVFDWGAPHAVVDDVPPAEKMPIPEYA